MAHEYSKSVKGLNKQESAKDWKGKVYWQENGRQVVLGDKEIELDLILTVLHSGTLGSHRTIFTAIQLVANKRSSIFLTLFTDSVSTALVLALKTFQLFFT